MYTRKRGASNKSSVKIMNHCTKYVYLQSLTTLLLNHVPIVISYCHLQQCHSLSLKLPEILRNFLKLYMFPFFSTGRTGQNFLKSVISAPLTIVTFAIYHLYFTVLHALCETSNLKHPS